MSAPSTETLSIGIVTYNHGDLIEATLRSVLTSLPDGLATRVWVLDNKSSDDTLAVAKRVASTDTRVTVEQNSINEGFGRANNRILEQLNSTYHVLCNPDITMTAGALETLISFLQANSDVGIVCPRVLFDDGRLQPLNRRNPAVVDLFLRRFMPRSLRPLCATRMRRYDMLDVGYDQSYDVPFVSGAFMACRTAVLKSVGGFDSRYFLYFEDADLSRSVQEQGWRTMYCPEAVVVHGWQRSAHSSYRAMFHFCVSAARYFNKWGWKFY